MKKSSSGNLYTMFTILLLFCFYACVFAWADGPAGIHVGTDDRCPVCGMKVSHYPKFACIMELVDGKTFSFCASGCMIRSWLHPETYLGIKKSDIQHIWVQDYFTGEKIDGTSAYWIGGSDVIGPMGPAFVPLKSQVHLEAFKRRHGGKTVFHLLDLDDEKWEEITGKK